MQMEFNPNSVQSCLAAQKNKIKYYEKIFFGAEKNRNDLEKPESCYTFEVFLLVFGIQTKRYVAVQKSK